MLQDNLEKALFGFFLWSKQTADLAVQVASEEMNSTSNDATVNISQIHYFRYLMNTPNFTSTNFFTDTSILQWKLQIKNTLGADLFSSFPRLSFGGRFEPICNL